MWNPDDVHVQNMLSLFSYTDKDGEVCLTQKVDRPIGPIAPFGPDDVFWLSPTGLSGWDGQRIVPVGNDVLEKMPASLRSDFIMALDKAGWTVTESDIDPPF